MRASQLAQALGDAVAQRLGGEGWRRLVRTPRPPLTIGQFTLALRDGFAAVATLDWHGPAEIEPAGRTFGVPDGVEEIRRLDPDASSLEVTVAVGVSFEPLARLFEAIGGWVLTDLISEDVEDLDPRPAEPVLLLDSIAAIPPAVDRIAGMIGTYAVPFAERHAGIEQAIGVLSDRDLYEPREAAVLKAVLLTAAGRWGDARDALADLKAMDEEGDWDQQRRTRRIVRQLHRFLDAEGGLVIPETPACWPAPQPFSRGTAHRSFTETWARSRRESAARDEALNAARAMAPGSSREEIKALLEREQGARGLEVDPLGLERQMERLEAEREPFGRATLLIGGVRELLDTGRDIVSGIRRAVRDEDEPPPAWLRPPDRAAYPVGRIDEKRWAEVNLHPTAKDWLDRVAAHATKIGRTHIVEVWLERSSQPAGEAPSQLGVNIGEHRVGVLSGEPADAYQPAMDAAAERDELPWTEARLSLLNGPAPYLLQLPVPVPAQH